MDVIIAAKPEQAQTNVQAAAHEPLPPYMVEYLMTRRQALTFELAEVEDMLIRAGRIARRSIPPKCARK